MEITQWLQRWQAGDLEALDVLLPLVYDELRRIASSELRRNIGHDTLQPTALVHEVLLKLLGAEPSNFTTRKHLYATAAKVMRHLLVDRARAASRDKRGGGLKRVELIDLVGLPIEQNLDVLELHEHLEQLAKLDPRAAEMIELRFFVGLSVAEIAHTLEVDERTIYRDWAFARNWLAQGMAASSPATR
jgi:RNA polymerase sigma factor (TIGR02999 family)